MQVFDFPIWKIFAGPAVALLVSYLMTPPVKRFAENVGAIDVPKDARRVHDHPIPRMGGLAIFTGFVLSVLLFVNMSMQVMGLLLGAVIIAVMGALDDILCLNPWIKLGGQFLAALVAIRCGIVFDVISNPGFLDGEATIPLGWLSIPFTIMWIIACTNAVNLIDGLDGLAVGISAISSISMMIVSMILPAGIGSIPLILACLAGACFGFMPYNINPAKIFMGDVGSQFLGYVLSCVSIIGLFKFHAIITFLIPLLSLAVPLGDTIFAFFRRILHGQSPFHADRGHIHHKLIDMGMSQKQAVAVLYAISAVLGLIAVLVAGPGTGIRIVCIVVAFAISLTVWLFVFSKAHVHPDHLHPVHREGPAAAPAASSGAHAAPSAGTESREKQERVG
ncbi:MAG: undecaprenyl/decaprenyl-phosphate alpha-N-acetylglucosaminyl 1-phosphate transferase [Oscillospiraceae bacterium]|nr:undecaprenyl/decaprenyl-phosphate alpha-N-acetylglucosaminyl 1-phosphate transferase [Oscillospiraceae bacterium]